MSRRKKLQLPVNSSSPASCSVISSYFKSESVQQVKDKPEKSLKLSKFIASDDKPIEPVELPVPKKSVLNFLNLDEDFEKTPLKKVKKAPAPKAKKPKKEKVSKKQPKIKSALLKQEEALSEAITYQSLTEDIDPDELRLALAISRSEAESKGLPVDDLESLKKFTFTKQAKTTKTWLKGKGKWANKISALTFRDPEVETKKLQERVTLILENIDINLNLPRASDDSEEIIFIFTSPELCGLLDHKKHLNKGENLETIESVEDYYIAGLFEPSTVKSGHLLKSYKYIPGREVSPKKNMESVVYEILDDCEIVRRIEGNSTSQKDCEDDKDGTFQEYDVDKSQEVVKCDEEREVNQVNDRDEVSKCDLEDKEVVECDKKEEFSKCNDEKNAIERNEADEKVNEETSKSDVVEVENEILPNLKKKHQVEDFKSPCGSPVEKRKRIEEIFMSPDLFCDSDDEEPNVLNRGVVELDSDEEETTIEHFKLPSIKNPTQLFGSEEPSSQNKDLETLSTLEVNTNEDIFDLTQTLDSEEEEEIKDPCDSEGIQNLDDSEEEEEIKDPCVSERIPKHDDSKSGDEIKDPCESEEIQSQDDSESEEKIRNLDELPSVVETKREVKDESEIFDLTQCLDSDSEEEKVELRIPSPELFDLTEDLDPGAKEDSDDCIILSDDDEECVKMKDESLKDILGEQLDSGSKSKSEEIVFDEPKANNKRISNILPVEEYEDSPPKKRRSHSFENDFHLSPEPSSRSRRSKSFHEDSGSPVNVCNLTFEELRAKYGLTKTVTPCKDATPVRKSFSQPAPTGVSEMDDDDFFDKLIGAKFKKRPVRAPSPDSPGSSASSVIESQLMTLSSESNFSLSQPKPSTSGTSATKPKPSTSLNSVSQAKITNFIPSTSTSQPSTSKNTLSTKSSKKSSEVKKTAPRKKKTAKDEEEVVIDQKVYLVKTENIPEKPNYAEMDKETLSVYLKKYGIKELTRKQSVAILDHIYNTMHPLMVDETDEE